MISATSGGQASSAPGAGQATSIVQLAAASLIQSDEAHQSAELKSQSQKLKEEIDRLKSSIPVSAIVRQQQQSETRESTTSRREALRQQRQLRDSGAPLASLDCSITIGGCSQVRADQNNNNNINININSSASFDSTTASSGLSGYFECDELSDMVDDSLFELTNAGCLSRSVFPREDKMSTRRAGPGGSLEDDGERTPTNDRERVIWGDGSSGPQVVALPPHGLDATQGHDIRTSAVPRPVESTTISSSSSSSSSLVAHQTPRADKLTSERKPAPAAVAGSGRHRKTTTTTTTGGGRSQISCGQPGERKKIAAATACSNQPDDSPVVQEKLIPGKPHGPGQHRQRREEKKVDAKRRQAKTTRSQSNSMLAEGSARQKAVNSRCPICCEQAAAAAAGAQSNLASKPAKKPAGRKRRFTFSLFNLFTTGGGGGGGQDAATTGNGGDIDGEDEMSPPRGHPTATCHHHDLTSAQDPIRCATSASASAPSHSGRRAGGGRQPAGGPSTRGVSGATPTASDSPLLSLRLRDSIKITNQRKARHQMNQSNRVAARGAPTRVSGNDHAPSHGSTSELLLDLSTGGAGDNSTSHPPPGPSGTTKGKCVKFTTPDRVLIMSPPPTSDATTSRRPPAAARLPASASVTAGLSGSPPAPIIKRSTMGVPKSSSYSQTEPNKGLDELLARYERDTSLVAEINQKLHLTETIASNRAALDSLDQAEATRGGDSHARGQDDIDEQLLEVARRQQELAAKSSSSFDIDDPTLRTRHPANNGGGGGEEHPDFSRCDCLSSAAGESAANKRRAADRPEIKSCAGEGGADNEAQSRRTLSAPAPATGAGDQFKLISDLTRGREGENMIRANGGGGAGDPNAENNQIYEPRQRQHRRRADTASGTRRARAFAAADARHSSSLDQQAAARHQRAGDSSQAHAEDAATTAQRPGAFSREWLGKQARALV